MKPSLLSALVLLAFSQVVSASAGLLATLASTVGELVSTVIGRVTVNAQASDDDAGHDELMAAMARRIESLEAMVESLKTLAPATLLLHGNSIVHGDAPLTAPRSLASGASWPSWTGISTTPALPDSFYLAMNVDTGDGHMANFANFEFWQSATNLGGASGSLSAPLTYTFKDLSVFGTFIAHQILVVVHMEGVAQGWRTWDLVSSTKPLQDYFGGAGRNNVCATDQTLLTPKVSNALATSMTGGNVGFLVAQEPLVNNNGDNGKLYTNTGNSCEAYGCVADWNNDFNRITTSQSVPHNLGFGVGGLYDANYDGGAFRCNQAFSTRPVCDAQMHTTVAEWGSGGGIGGMIGTDHYCNGGCPWTVLSGYNYDYAFYVAKKCAAGQYSAPTSTTCSACPAGRSQPLADQVSCTVCSAGTYQPTSGATLCAACAAGSYCASTGLTAVTDTCSAGKYSAGGATSCINCGAGQYQPSAGQGSCPTCAAGQWQLSEGQVECLSTAAPTSAPTSSPVLATRFTASAVETPVLDANSVYAKAIFLKSGQMLGAGGRRLVADSAAVNTLLDVSAALQEMQQGLRDVQRKVNLLEEKAFAK